MNSLAEVCRKLLHLYVLILLLVRLYNNIIMSRATQVQRRTACRKKIVPWTPIYSAQPRGMKCSHAAGRFDYFPCSLCFFSYRNSFWKFDSKPCLHVRRLRSTPDAPPLSYSVEAPTQTSRLVRVPQCQRRKPTSVSGPDLELVAQLPRKATGDSNYYQTYTSNL